MTNGENLKNIYPDLEIISEIKDVYVIMLEAHNVWSPKLEVFKSWWNAEYKEPTIKNDLEFDCISREAVLKLFNKSDGYGWEMSLLKSKIKKMPSVTPIRPKGHWTNGNPICPCCGEDKFKDLDADIWADWRPKYCPNCGARMTEVSE